MRPGPAGRRSGWSTGHGAKQWGQRGWKRQPGGGSSGEGISPWIALTGCGSFPGRRGNAGAYRISFTTASASPLTGPHTSARLRSCSPRADSRNSRASRAQTRAQEPRFQRARRSILGQGLAGLTPRRSASGPAPIHTPEALRLQESLTGEEERHLSGPDPLRRTRDRKLRQICGFATDPSTHLMPRFRRR